MLTKSQITALKQAVADGGEIIMRGIDATDPTPNRRVVRTLVSKGLLRYDANAQIGYSIGIHDYLVITDAGKQAVEACDA